MNNLLRPDNLPFHPCASVCSRSDGIDTDMVSERRIVLRIRRGEDMWLVFVLLADNLFIFVNQRVFDHMSGGFATNAGIGLTHASTLFY